MKKTIPPNSFDFVSDDIVNCWTHSKKHGMSYLTKPSRFVKTVIPSVVIKMIVEDLICSTIWIT